MITYWHVILLPALERVYPSLCSQYVLLMLAEIYQVSTDYLLTGNVYASEEEVTQLNAVIETLTGMVQRLQRSENK